MVYCAGDNCRHSSAVPADLGVDFATASAALVSEGATLFVGRAPGLAFDINPTALLA